uniref:DUF6493 family protein n=1 Tax=Prevotella sp. GTC17260 TaxID=3236796 RepID=A0AB33J9N7_9BACT
MEKEERIKRFTKLAKEYKDSPENRQEKLLPYIKELAAMTEKERHELAKTNQELYWNHTKTSIGDSWTSCSHDRAVFLDATSVLTSDGKNYNSYALRDNDVDLLRSILDIHKPKWLDKQLDKNPFESLRYGYHNILKLATDGYIKQPKPERIADLVAEAHEIRLENNDISFDSSQLLQLPITLDEHVWYLFEYPTSIAYHDQRARAAFAEGRTAKDESISALLITCARTGRISSGKLLDKTIEGLNRSLHIQTEGWLTDLLSAYQPTSEEILERQALFLQALYTVKSRAQNTILKLLKQVATAEGFLIQPYIDTSQSLLFSLPANSLTVICSTYEALMKKHHAYRTSICEILGQLIVHKNDTVKRRANKLIATYGGNKLAEIQQQIDTSTPEIPTLQPLRPQPYCTEANRLAAIDNKDEFIFRLSRLFDTTDPLEQWTVVSATAEWFPRLEAADQPRLESIFARAAQLPQMADNYLPALLATYILEFSLCLQQRFEPKPSKGRQMMDMLKKSILNLKTVHQTHFSPLADFNGYATLAGHIEGFKQFLLELLGMIKAGNTVVLSVPTHRPGYIDAETLVHRLAEYERTGHRPSPFDLQVALNRCTWNPAKSVDIPLSGELKQLMEYLIHDRFEPCKHYQYPEAWLAVNLRNHPEAMRREFADFYFNHRAWPLWTGTLALASELVPNPHFKQLQFDYDEATLHAPTQPMLWQEIIWEFRTDWYNSPYIALHLTVFPHHPTIVLAQILRQCAVFDNKQSFYTNSYMNALQWLMDYQEAWTEVGVLFLATALVHYDSTVRTYAAEIWATATLLGTIDNHALGLQTARLIALKAFPLRRLQTIVADSMRHRSTLHDDALHQFFAPILATLPDKMTGAKGIRELAGTLNS